MSRHGAEQFLPLSELAQWMRDTTGRQGEFTTTLMEFAPYYEVRASDDSWVEEIDVAFVYDKDRLYQAAREAIDRYHKEGKTREEIKEHARRIWALHDQILGETA
jgi:hypothetical protein